MSLKIYYIRNKTMECNLRYNNAGFLTSLPNIELPSHLLCLERRCRIGEYKCQIAGYCINIRLICDGIIHCPYGEDEENCGSNSN